MQGSLPQTHQSGPDSQHRVLLVDDDAVSLEILTLMLGFDGHEVLRAADGESALALLAHPASTAVPDVLLVDMQMPGISGHELAQRVRAMKGPKPLLLGMSATALNTKQLRGFDGFLLKPLELNDLRVALEPAKTSSNGKRKISRNGTQDRPPAQSKITASSPQGARSAQASPSQRKLGPALEEEQPINPAVLNKLRSAMPLESLKELYSACLTDSRDRAFALQALARDGKLCQIPREAHQIKGAASMVGADRIARLAAILELGSCEKADTLPLLNDLLNACDQLERILLAGKLEQTHDNSDK